MIYLDQMNRKVELSEKPKRIISLVPSITELLFDLGLRDEVVGITKFCIHPKEWHQTKPRIGGTKQLYFDKISALKPDLIIGNKEENTKELIEQLEKEYSVYLTDINSIEESYDAIFKLGEILHKESESLAIINQSKRLFLDFQNSEKFNLLKNKEFLYFIWHHPDMVAGKSTYIDDVFKNLGMENGCSKQRYPEFAHDKNVEYILLSSEPYPFKEKNIPYFQNIYPNAKIILVDGEIFSWYGSRVLKIISYTETVLLKKMFNQ